MDETGNGVTGTVRGKVLEIVIDRPTVNAIDKATSKAIHAQLRRLQEDDSLVVGIITGVGKMFSAGWDMKALAKATSLSDVESDASHGGFGGITEYHGLNKPVIAAVNGHAVGGGFEMVLACDVVVAAEDACFWLPEMQRGFLADAGALQRLPRKIPYNVAVDLLLTGRRLTAEEAARWGLVVDVVTRERVMEVARSRADALAKSAPLALQALKATLREIMSMPIPEALARTKKGKSGIDIYERMAASEDALEGPRAFIERREPRWLGR